VLESCESLEDWEYVSHYWEGQPPAKHLHVLVTLPGLGAASYVPSADILRLTIVPIDGKTYGRPFHIDVDPSTTIVVVHNLIRDKLRTIRIGEFYRKPLEILPVQSMPTLEQLNGEDLAGLRK